MYASDSDADSTHDESDRDVVPEPLPLFSMAEVGGVGVQTTQTITGAAIRHVEFLPTTSFPAKECHLHDPLTAKKVSKWFMIREMKESRLEKVDLNSCDYTDGIKFEQSILHNQVYLNQMFSNLDSNAASYSDATALEKSHHHLEMLNGDIPDLTFDSEFESGNLESATRVYGRESIANLQRLPDVLSNCTAPISAEYEYDLVIRSDLYTDGNIQWYFFSASCGEDSGFKFPCRVRFNIINMQKRDSLYNYGMKPAIYSDSSAKEGKSGWTRGCDDICYFKNEQVVVTDCGGKKKMRPRYTLTYSYLFKKPDTVYFAHCFPYTYTSLQRYVKDVQDDDRISKFCRVRSLATTLAKNTCDILTITAKSDRDNDVRNRPSVVISARVHPGETNASFMMHGVIQFLTSEDPMARTLRDYFVFRIVPMLNPDGVIHGNYRCSLTGQDLNRRYADCSPTFHPTIAAMKGLLESVQQSSGVYLYLDLHGHSRNKNAFVYGCDLHMTQKKVLKKDSFKPESIIDQRIFSRIFPQILCQSRNGYYCYRDCTYTVQSSKAGTGRVVAWKDLGISSSYTIEASFCGNGCNSEAKTIRKYFESTSRGMISDYDLSSNTEDAMLEKDKGDDDDDDDDDDEMVNKTMDSEDALRRDAIPHKKHQNLEEAVNKLMEQYKMESQYSENDLIEMGADICRAIFHMANLREGGPQSQIPRSNSQSSQEPDQQSQEAMSPHAVCVLDTCFYEKPILATSIYSSAAIKDAIRCAIEEFEAASESGKVSECDAPSSSFLDLGKRVAAEIAVRKQLKQSRGIDASSLAAARARGDKSYQDRSSKSHELQFESESEIEIVVYFNDNEYENEENGSDSDPSVDNLSMIDLMKTKSIRRLAGCDAKVKKKRSKPKPKRRASVSDISERSKEEKEEKIRASRPIGRMLSDDSNTPTRRRPSVFESPILPSRDREVARRVSRVEHCLPRFMPTYKLEDDRPKPTMKITNLQLGGAADPFNNSSGHGSSGGSMRYQQQTVGLQQEHLGATRAVGSRVRDNSLSQPPVMPVPPPQRLSPQSPITTNFKRLDRSTSSDSTVNGFLNDLKMLTADRALAPAQPLDDTFFHRRSRSPPPPRQDLLLGPKNPTYKTDHNLNRSMRASGDRRAKGRETYAIVSPNGSSSMKDPTDDVEIDTLTKFVYEVEHLCEDDRPTSSHANRYGYSSRHSFKKSFV
jgi:hypothetical protein